MHFQRFVKRSTKGIFIGIIAIMTVTLVVSFGPGFTTSDEEKGDAGIIFGNAKIKKADFTQHKKRALGHLRYLQLQERTQTLQLLETAMQLAADKLLEEDRIQRLIMKLPSRLQYIFQLPPEYRGQYGRQMLHRWASKDGVYNEYKNVPDSELVRQTWSHVILLRDAKDKGIAVSDDEAGKAREAFVKGFDLPGKEVDPELAAAEFLAIPGTQMETFFREALMLEKLLELVCQSEFCAYAPVYEALVSRERFGRALYAAFNPEDFERSIKPIRFDDPRIGEYFNKNKNLFKQPVQISVLYLMAEIEKFVKKVPDLTDTEIQKYYDDHKDKYTKPGPAKELKPLPEVRDEVVKALKEERAGADAKEVMRDVERKILEYEQAEALKRIESGAKDLGVALNADLSKKLQALVRDESSPDKLLMGVREELKKAGADIPDAWKKLEEAVRKALADPPADAVGKIEAAVKELGGTLKAVSSEFLAGMILAGTTAEKVVEALREAKVEVKGPWERFEEAVRGALRSVPGTLFDEIKKQYESQGVELTAGSTAKFDQKKVADIEKEVGGRSGLGTWGFESDRKEGDVSDRMRTEKGYAYFLILSRQDEMTPTKMDNLIEERIKWKLRREQKKKRAGQAANDFSQEINTRGLAAARAKFPLVETKATGYFKLDGSSNPLEGRGAESGLGPELNKHVKGLPIETAAVFSGSQVPGKADWSFVAYLDDQLDRTPDGEEVEDQFKKLRDLETIDARLGARQAYADDMRKWYLTQDLVGTGAAAPKEGPAHDHEHEHPEPIDVP